MVRDFKYIIKRILIGTGIALLLMLIKGSFIYPVNALEISSISTGGSGRTITNATQREDYNITGNPWSNWGTGYLYFNFSVSKISGSSTDPIVIPRSVAAYSGNSNFYVCNLGTVNTNNSTFVGATFSVKCPMKMGSSGLTKVSINFNNNNTGSSFSSYGLMIEDIFTFEQISSTSVNVDNSGTINNDNQNTQNIINNDNTNTQDIINNQNSNTEKEIDSNKVCNTIHLDKSYVEFNNQAIQSNGVVTNNDSYIITRYIELSENATIKVTQTHTTSFTSCFYREDKTRISCYQANNLIVGQFLTIPSSAKYFRASINKVLDRPLFDIFTCQNGNQALNDSINNQTESINNINNTINDDSVDNSTGNDFFNNFESNNHGLSGLITIPFRLLDSLTTATCSPLSFQLPFVHDVVVLPCMRPIYENYFGVFFSLYQLITTGLICYAVMINLYSKIHNLQNPNNDRIEVLNL